MPDLTTILATALAAVRPPDPEFAEEAAAASGLSVNWPGWAQAIVAAIPDAERDSLEFGLAWLRAERALPHRGLWLLQGLQLVDTSDSDDLDDERLEWEAEAVDHARGGQPQNITALGPTPTAALTARAEALEARHGE